MKRTIAEVVKEEEGVRGGIRRGRRKRRKEEDVVVTFSTEQGKQEH